MTDPATARRPFRPTPAWLICGLLVVEGLLWLSERYQWFGFNEKKGWTVLIAVAAVGVAMLVMLGWFVVALVFRWRFQFSIRSLLVLVVVVALPFSWLAVEMRAARKQKEAVAAIEKLHGTLFWDRPAVPRWLRSLLGDDFFDNVDSIFLFGPKTGNAWLENLDGLSRLKTLALDRTQITDADLGRLEGLSHLQELLLERTEITDIGLEKLKGWSQLQKLSLYGTKVTDAGLEHLGELKLLTARDPENWARG